MTPRTFRFSCLKPARRNHMKLIIRSAAASAVCCASLSPAFAAPDPSMADSPTPSMQYKSPFKDYRPLGDDKRTPWRDANDEVGKIGGWRVYLRESQEASKAATETAPALKAAPPAASLTPTPAPPSSPAKSPAPDNSNLKTQPSEHAGHGQHQ